MLPDDDERFEPDTDRGLSVGFQFAVGLVLIIGFAALTWFLFGN